MSVSRNLEREQVRRFVQYWDRLLQVVPEARKEAVEAAGEAVKRSLNTQIQSANLSSGEAKGRVKSWQELRLGSGGGWANFGARARQHTWRGRAVTARQVTGWLERGHGIRPSGYVAGRQLYAYTKDDAQQIALKAADKVLSRIADEVDF